MQKLKIFILDQSNSTFNQEAHFSTLQNIDIEILELLKARHHLNETTFITICVQLKYFIVLYSTIHIYCIGSYLQLDLSYYIINYDTM